MKKNTVITSIFVVVVLIVSGLLLWRNLEDRKPAQVSDTDMSTKPAVEQLEVDPNKVDDDWRVYQNEDLGIVFEYPSIWGEIQESKDSTPCDGGEARNPEEGKCQRITLSVGNLKNEKRVFLATETLAYTSSHLDGRYAQGAAWDEKVRVIPKDKEDFCSNNPYLPKGTSFVRCSVLKTEHGISVAVAEGIVPFTDNEQMTSFFIRTDNPLYYDLIVSSVELEKIFPTSKIDMRKLVESIRPL